MRIIACLAWFHEPPDFLYRSVASLEGFADELVAYDGGWDLFPGACPRSTDAEHAAIEAGAIQAGIAWTIYEPDCTWASQVEKRSALMIDASTRGDWLFVIDGDEYIATANAPIARKKLDDTGLDVATVACKRTTGFDGVNAARPIRRIYRAATGVHVETAHNGYRTADGRWLHGDGAFAPLEPAEPLAEWVLLHHEHRNRGEERNRAALDYRKARLETGAERWRR